MSVSSFRCTKSLFSVTCFNTQYLSNCEVKLRGKVLSKAAFLLPKTNENTSVFCIFPLKLCCALESGFYMSVNWWCLNWFLDSPATVGKQATVESQADVTEIIIWSLEGVFRKEFIRSTWKKRLNLDHKNKNLTGLFLLRLGTMNKAGLFWSTHTSQTLKEGQKFTLNLFCVSGLTAWNTQRIYVAREMEMIQINKIVSSLLFRPNWSIYNYDEILPCVSDFRDSASLRGSAPHSCSPQHPCTFSDMATVAKPTALGSVGRRRVSYNPVWETVRFVDVERWTVSHRQIRDPADLFAPLHLWWCWLSAVL